MEENVEKFPSPILTVEVLQVSCFVGPTVQNPRNHLFKIMAHQNLALFTFEEVETANV